MTVEKWRGHWNSGVKSLMSMVGDRILAKGNIFAHKWKKEAVGRSGLITWRIWSSFEGEARLWIWFRPWWPWWRSSIYENRVETYLCWTFCWYFESCVIWFLVKGIYNILLVVCRSDWKIRLYENNMIITNNFILQNLIYSYDK